MNTALCAACGQTILWARTIAGKSMPLTLPADDTGIVFLVDGVAHTVSLFDQPTDDLLLYRPHFADCPTWADTYKEKR